MATMGAVTTPYCALIMELMPWGSLKASLNDTRRREHYDFKKMIRGMMSICRAGAYLGNLRSVNPILSPSLNIPQPACTSYTETSRPKTWVFYRFTVFAFWSTKARDRCL